jgi:gluconolactonase
VPAFTQGGSTGDRTGNPPVGAGNTNSGGASSTAAPSTGGSAQGGSAQGGSEAGGDNVVNNTAQGGTSSGGAQDDNTGGSMLSGGGTGQGGNPMPNDDDPVGDDDPAAPGRAGAELCPAGPFAEPVPANVQVTKLFSVGVDNFFNWEGPVWLGDALYFSEIGGGNTPPPSQINRLVGGTLERGVIPDTGSNGLALGNTGNLIAATHDVGAISSFEVPNGARGEVGAQAFNGQRFNSPNDVVVRNDGNVYFTDPTFQAPGNPQGATRLYRLSPSGEASVVDDSLSNPNGVTLSPDGNTLYATGGSRFVRYELSDDGTPSGGQDIPLGADALQTPDGMAVDCAGNIYTTEHSRRLIRVFNPDGTEIDRFGGDGAFDREITNLAFGGPNRTTLFVTSLTQGQQGGLFSAELNIPGLPY